jgi:2-phospho-L-lactate/phosphoenolpyruvate guanylyltransferase
MAPDADLLAARPATLTWSLVVPVKVLAQAKSRLTGLADDRRSKFALAMAADTIAAAVEADTVGAVIVVTDDPEVGHMAAEIGAFVLPDTPRAGLNEALAHGAGYSERRWPEHGRAALAGDLPALKPGELTVALAAAARAGTAFVPDADGTGTTLYAAGPGAPFSPQFGPASRDKHVAAGAAELEADGLAGLRRDVDTVEDLRAAARIGLGPRTRLLVAPGSWV